MVANSTAIANEVGTALHMEPTIDAGAMLAMAENGTPVQKLACVGAQSGRAFEFPQTVVSSLDGKETVMCHKDFGARLVDKVRFHIGVGIYSIQLVYSDGSESPCLGSRSDFNDQIELGEE